MMTNDDSLRTPPSDITNPAEQPKRGRGRPKGVKNKKKTPAPTQIAITNPNHNSSNQPTLANFQACRYIGLQHRVKTTTSGEERPTRVAILVPDMKKPTRYELGAVRSEIDFAAGVYPVSYRKLEDGENVSQFERPWQLKSKELPAAEALELDAEEMGKAMADLKNGKVAFVSGRSIILRPNAKGKMVPHTVTEIPTEFDGLRAGDLVGMSLGGSGDALAVLFANYANGGSEIMIARTPPARLKAYREEITGVPTASEESVKDDDDVEEGVGKAKDDVVLAQMVRDRRVAFYAVTPDERSAIAVRLAWHRVAEVMAARIAMKQRLIGAARTAVYVNSDRAHLPHGDLTLIHNEMAVSDAAYLAMLAEEKLADKGLQAALNRLPAYRLILSRVTGVGPRLAGRLMSAMGDIARFECTEYDAEIASLRTEIVAARAAMKFDELLPKVFTVRKVNKPEELRFKGTQDTSRKDFNWWQATQIARDLTQSELDSLSPETDRTELETRLTNLDEILQLMRSRGRLKRLKFRKSRNRFIAYNGLNPDPKTGQFRRRKAGELANWSGTGRQTGWLLLSQMLKVPKAIYGRYLIAIKQALRAKHPEIVVVPPKKPGGKPTRKYTNGHIQSMAGWRLATRFFEWFFGEVWHLREQGPENYRFREPQYPSIAAMATEANEPPSPANSADEPTDEDESA